MRRPQPGDDGVHPYWRVWNNAETLVIDGRKYLMFADADVSAQWTASYPCFPRPPVQAQWTYPIPRGCDE